MPVHDVHMDHTSAARNRGFHLLSQMREIGREYRGCQFDQNNVRELGSSQRESVEILARAASKETLIKCGAGIPARVKASTMHNFPCWQILVKSLPNQANQRRPEIQNSYLFFTGTPRTPTWVMEEWAGFCIDRQ